MNLDAELAAARERLHRSIGQRARWALYAIAARTERERAVMHRALNRIFEPPPVDPRQNAWPLTPAHQEAYYAGMANMAIPNYFQRLVDPFYREVA